MFDLTGLSSAKSHVKLDKRDSKVVIKLIPVYLLKMKFNVTSVAKSARFGCLSDFSRIPEAVLETPLLLLHTRVLFKYGYSCIATLLLMGSTT